MPELPEVETLRRGLERRLIGRTITGTRVLVPKMVKGTYADPNLFAQHLQGRRIESIGRRGKHLIFALDSGYYLMFHMKMRGGLLIVPGDSPEEKYLAMALATDDGQELRFHDMWTWGEARLVTAEELAAHPALASMGVEPFADEFTPLALEQALARKARTSIKAALLDQTVLAGVGNIYADEALFRSRILPTRPAGGLTREETVRLRNEIRTVLGEATGGGGTTSDNYVDVEGTIGRYTPRVYERAGQPCLNCGTMLERLKVAGRGTVYCPLCQT